MTALRDKRQGIHRAEWALRLNKLGVRWDGFAVVFDMCLGRFRGVMHCMLVVTAC